MKASFKKFPRNRITVFLHIIAWVILFIIPIYLIYIDSSNDVHFVQFAYLQTLCYALIFYINYFILVPKLFFVVKRRIYYLVSVIVLLAFFSFAVDFITQNDFFSGNNKSEINPVFKNGDLGKHEFKRMKPSKKWPMYNNILTSLLVSGFALGLRFSDKMIQNDKKRKEAEKEKLNTELALLKNQISPHFFFNTLNNIYALSQSSSPDAPKSIMQLSRLMRYLIYETDQGKVLLSQEIDFMRNYIELMKLRISSKVIINVDFPNEYIDVSIPPLLFIPFVENAFKHGISYQEASFVSVKIIVDASKILFECHNSHGFKTNGEEPHQGNFGLDNIKKRLNLLFQNNHDLEIQQSESEYKVLLTLQFK